MSRDHTSQSPDKPERRRSRRFTTSRRARFVDNRANAPLQTGRVVDMSPSGLRIESSASAVCGQTFEIEIEPEVGGDPMLLRGEVTHAEPGAAGKFSIGMESRFDVKGTLKAITRADIASENFAAAYPETSAPQSVPETQEVPTRRWNRYLTAFALALLLLVLAGLMGLSRVQRNVDASGNGGVARSSIDRIVTPLKAPDVSTGVFDQSSRPHVNDAKPEATVAPHDAGDIVPDDRVYATLDSSAYADSSKVLATDPDPAAAARMRRYVSRVEHAEAAARRGDRNLARKLFRDALDESEGIPAVWTDKALRELESIDAKPPVPSVFEPMDTELKLAISDRAGVPPLLIEVDAANYVLNVRRNDAIVRSFPVGLGRDGATPYGRSKIVDKISNPDWYDRGRTVPAGSPENPLGASWMGLARDDRGTGIGIHPSPAEESMEQPISRGCVRMRPGDAETLFRLVPAGTPVWIHE